LKPTGVAATSALLFGCAVGGGLGAQSIEPPPDLTRIEAAVDSGRVRGAREAVERWLAVTGDAATPADLERAGLLRARLMTDADSARSEYLRIAIDGQSSYGAEAWLRLAQLDLALGDPERAADDLQRLRADYPTGEWVSESWYWSGRALEVSGNLTAACEAWGRASTAARETGQDEVHARSMASSRSCEAGELRLTVQLGAFRVRSAAEAVAERAGEAGFPARIVEEEGLYKVRVGHFGRVEAAREMAKRVRAAGFSALITAEKG
jgi:tetratricopeptide (TPR) repeat protein